MPSPGIGPFRTSPRPGAVPSGSRPWEISAAGHPAARMKPAPMSRDGANRRSARASSTRWTACCAGPGRISRQSSNVPAEHGVPGLPGRMG